MSVIQIYKDIPFAGELLLKKPTLMSPTSNNTPNTATLLVSLFVFPLSVKLLQRKGHEREGFFQ